MIYGKLSEIAQYACLSEIYAQLRALTEVSAAEITKQPRRVQVNGTHSYFTLTALPARNTAAQRLEVHQKAIDIHCVFEGCEKIYFGGTEGLAIQQAYDDVRDIAFYSGAEENVCYLHAGEFAIFWPGEVHSPLNMAHDCETIKKAVGKIFPQT